MKTPSHLFLPCWEAIRLQIHYCAIGGCALLTLLIVVGCASPSAANNVLREQNFDLRQKMDLLQRQNAADRAAIVSLQQKRGTLATLPQDRLDMLVTVAGVKLKLLTGGYTLDPATPGDQGIKIYACPIDVQGDLIKAAGTFVVEAFDTHDFHHPLIGHWTFDLAQTKADWYGAGLLYNYILTCPWQQVPRDPNLMVVVTFFDELTQRDVPQAKMDINVNLPAPATTQSAPATAK